MGPMIRNSLVAAFLMILVAAPVRGAGLDERAGEFAREKAGAAVERQRSRELRFVARLLEELKNSAITADKESEELERLIDAIVPLEPPKREVQVRAFLEWYRGYAAWLDLWIADLEDELARVRSEGRGARWRGRLDELLRRTGEFEARLAAMVKKYDGELQRLNRLIDKKRFLLERSRELDERLARTEERLADRERPAAKRAEDEKKAAKLRVDLQVAQRELLALADVNEELLKHYAALIEMGQGEDEWLALKIEQYEALRDVAGTIAADDVRDAVEIRGRYRGFIRECEGWIGRLRRMIDSLDRKRDLVSSVAGTPHELSRSQELASYYDRLKTRYEKEVERLRLLIGAYDAELSELPPPR